MKITKLNSTQNAVVSANHSMSSYLSGLEKGRSCTPRSWLFEKSNFQDVFNEWRRKAEMVLSNDPDGELIQQFEEQQISKLGPQGCVPPISESLEEAMSLQFLKTAKPGLFDTPAWNTAIDSARNKYFGKVRANLRRMSAEKVVERLRKDIKLNTNSGFPAFTKRNKPETIALALEHARSGEWKNQPAIILFRHYNGKLRPVWMFPMATNIHESQFTMLIQDILRAGKFPALAAWEGFEDVKTAVTKLWSEDNVRLVGGDIEKMDANFKLHHSEQVYKLLAPLFQEREREDLWSSMWNLHNIEILIGTDEKLVGEHGVASGSGWTQLVETLFQLIIAEYLQVECIVIGDDSVYKFRDKSISRAQFMVDLFKECGFPANLEKQSDDERYVDFVQRRFIKGRMSREDKHVLAGIYRTYRALNSQMNPEQFHDPDQWSSDMFCARFYMIEENTVDSPLFEAFCDFTMNGQKDIRSFAKESVSYQDTVWQKSKQISGLNPSYNQEKKDKPLSQFASIRYIASK